jgi:hypothetical protein
VGHWLRRIHIFYLCSTNCFKKSHGHGVWQWYHARDNDLDISMLAPLTEPCFSADFDGFCSSWQRCPISRLILMKKFLLDMRRKCGSIDDLPTLTWPSFVACHMASTAIQTCVVDFTTLCSFLLTTVVIITSRVIRVLECRTTGSSLHRLGIRRSCIVRHVDLRLQKCGCRKQHNRLVGMDWKHR